MGKKRTAETSAEEILKESDKQEAVLSKGRRTGKKATQFERGNIYIRSSYNNIMITVANERGEVLAWSSSGATGFKGPRKATPYAASRVVEVLLAKLEKVDFKEIHILVRGIGSGRDAAIRSLASRGLNITALKDITPIAHNGCRPKKPRRV
jgi:small subunit ribosomal protein S11